MKVLELKDYAIRFDETSGLIRCISKGEHTLELSGSIWRLETADKKLLTAQDMTAFSYTLSEKLTFAWEKEALHVTVHFFVDNGQLKSDIAVSGSKCALNRIHFPVYEGIRRLSREDDRLVLPWQTGFLIKNPVDTLLNTSREVPFWMGRGFQKYENDYPAQYSYQFFSYYKEGGHGCYWAAEDGQGYIKTVGVHYNSRVDGMDMVFTNYPEGMGEVNSYVLPYVYTFTFFEGDWQTAAKLYRAWAVNQKWYMPLKSRNISPSVKNIDFVRINHEHYALGSRSEEYIKTCRIIKEKLSCDPLMHWYGWNKAPKHGDWYPEMADYTDQHWHEELLDINARLRDAGVKKIPYVNVHLWDKHLKSFEAEQAQDTLILPESGVIADEPWCPERNLFAVCHSTQKVKTKALSLFERLVQEDGFDGIYIDQVASFNATLCFNKSHGHPVGGGNWWQEEYHKMITPLREAMPEDKILTTESCCECYHDLFDMFLTLDPCGQSSGFREICGCDNADTIPLLSMIYGDSVVAYGSICRFDNTDDRFEYNFARCILWGIIPTAEGMELQEIENADYKWQITKNGVDFYKANREVFLYGRLEEYITWEEGGKRISFGKNSQNCPGMIATVFSCEGRYHAFLYNYSETPKEVTLRGKRINVPSRTFTGVPL